jgi:uncharacterized membrane protein SirB2
MTQIDMREIAAVVVPRTQLNGMESSAAPWLEAFVALVIFFAGLTLGMLRKKRQRSNF